MVKNCDLGLEKVFSRPRSQFFTIRTSQPANNIYVLFQIMHLQRLPSLNFVDDGRLRRSATKVGYEGRLRRNECHATFHTFEISPSKLSNSVFSCVFSSWWRRLSTIRIHFNETSVFSSLFPMLSRIIFAHCWAWVFLDVEVNTTWKIAFLWNNTNCRLWQRKKPLLRRK